MIFFNPERKILYGDKLLPYNIGEIWQLLIYK